MKYCYGSISPTDSGHKCVIGDFWLNNKAETFIYNKVGCWEPVLDPRIIKELTKEERYLNAMKIIEDKKYAR